MTTTNTRDTCITLQRRFIIEANTTPLFTAAQEQRQARRIDTARRRLLAALAVWPSCIPRLLEDYAAARTAVRLRERIIIAVEAVDPEASVDMAGGATLITTRLGQLNEAHRQYLTCLAEQGWRHARTRQLRRALAAQLCAFRLHDSCLRRLLSLPDNDPAGALDFPRAAVRARIAHARRMVDEEKQRMVNANLRLVVSIARRYRYSAVAPADLIQEGNLGLLRAVEKFDVRRGFKFSTYAIWWIQRAMVLAITLQRSTLCIPAYALQAAHRAQRRAAQQLLLGEPAPSIAELASAEAMTVADLRAAYAACLPAVPLYGDGDDETAPINTLHDNRQHDPADILMQTQVRQQLHKVLAQLPARQAHVLRLRFGIGVDAPHTLDAIGQQLGLSRERIRQIEEQALDRLRADAHRTRLAALLGESGDWRPRRAPSDTPQLDSAS